MDFTLGQIFIIVIAVIGAGLLGPAMKSENNNKGNEMKTTYSNIMVKVHYAKKMSTMVVPDTAKQYYGDFYGEVVAIGPSNTLGLSVGDKVLFERHEGKEVEEDGEKYLVLKQDYVLGRLVE